MMAVDLGAVDLVSNYPTAYEFLDARRSMYDHDRPHYPMYFDGHEAAATSFEPTQFKGVSATSALENTLAGWLEDGDADVDVRGNTP
jgi:hypothetical protein